MVNASVVRWTGAAWHETVGRRRQGPAPMGSRPAPGRSSARETRRDLILERDRGKVPLPFELGVLPRRQRRDRLRAADAIVAALEADGLTGTKVSDLAVAWGLLLVVAPFFVSFAILGLWPLIFSLFTGLRFCAIVELPTCFATIDTSLSGTLVYVMRKSPTCGCCSKWVEHLQANGFTKRHPCILMGAQGVPSNAVRGPMQTITVPSGSGTSWVAT